MMQWGYSKKKEQAYPKTAPKKHLSSIVGSITAKNGKTKHSFFAKNRKKVMLENRANMGIRAYTDTIYYHGEPLILEIGTHVVRGSYYVEPEWKSYSWTPEMTELSKELKTLGFPKFEDAVSFIEEKFNVDVKLDKKRSNDYQTWEQNIEQTDRELPYEKKFWSLPEPERDELIRGKPVRETFESFFKRKEMI